MRRLRVLAVGVLVALGTVLATSSAAGQNGHNQLVRWDIVQFGENGDPVVLAGGTAISKDQRKGHTVALTGSGQAEPLIRDAAGGGTFVHRDAHGKVVFQGIYWVPAQGGFISWDNRGGSFVGSGFIDGIGDIEDTKGGILKLNVLLRPQGSTSTISGVLEIQCVLPGSTNGFEEGVILRVLDFNFTPVEEEGFTLFHLLR